MTAKDGSIYIDVAAFRIVNNLGQSPALMEIIMEDDLEFDGGHTFAISGLKMVQTFTPVSGGETQVLNEWPVFAIHTESVLGGDFETDSKTWVYVHSGAGMEWAPHFTVGHKKMMFNGELVNGLACEKVVPA